MTIKVICIHKSQEPLLMGADRLPVSYRAPAREMVNKHAGLMVPCRPYSLGEIAKLIRAKAATIEERVDADLLEEFDELSLENKPAMGMTLYRLEEDMLPV